MFPAFEYRSPTRAVFGPGKMAELGNHAKQLGGTRALLVTDPGLEKAGHPQKAVSVLEEAGLTVFVFDDVEENPSSIHVQRGVDYASPLDIDLIVAVGGGSAMDCAKGINFLLTNGGIMSDYKGFGRAKLPMLPSIGVPTTAGTGSEAQSFALIADASSHMKMACGDLKAAFHIAILDPEITLSQPPKVAALTGIDALAHAVEAYVCKKRNNVSMMFAHEAWRLLEPNLETVLRDPKNLDARGSMQLGAFLAGTAIENSMLGVCHSCANPLTAHYGLTHGLVIGILLPHVIRFNSKVVPELYVELAKHVDSSANHRTAPDILEQRIAEFMKLAGVSTSLSAYGVSEGILPLLAEEAACQWTAQFNPRTAGEDELLYLYQAAL